MERVENRTDRIKMGVILAAGCILRLFYVLFSTIYDRQYDIGMIDLDAGHTVTGGHLAYIQYLYENWKLPDFDPTSVYQFNHPPLHHYLCALWMKFCSLFISNTDILEESIQVVPFVCSLFILWFLLRIVEQFALTQKAKRFVMLLFCFHPALVLLSGSVNNDCMSLLFTVMCVYYTILWSRFPTVHNILKLAISIALGMLTKQSVAQMAFPIAAVMLWMLARSLRGGRGGSMRRTRGAGSTHGVSAVHSAAGGGRSVSKAQCVTGGVGSSRNAAIPVVPAKKLLGQYVLFGAVSIPIGMSFYIRNMIQFHMPLVWIYTLPEDSWQYTGNVPVLNRFLFPIPSEMLENLRQFKLGCGYNVWMQIIRTSVLGEWDMADVGRGVKVLAVLLMFVGALLAFAALVAFIRVFVVRAKRYGIDSASRILFVVGYFVHLLLYLKFAYDYPQECSMHFRYMEIELLFPAIALAYIWQEGTKEQLKTQCREVDVTEDRMNPQDAGDAVGHSMGPQNMDNSSGHPAVKRAVSQVLFVLLIVFCILSTAMTAVWCLL